MKKIIKGCEKFITFFAILGTIVIVFMALMICLDIILRLFGRGVKGSVELTVYLVPIIAYLGVGYTTIKGHHIRMELFENKVLDRIMNTICIVFLAIIGWACWKETISTIEAGQITALLKIPRWPIAASTGFGMWMVTLALILTEIKEWMAVRDRLKGLKDIIKPSSESDAEQGG